MPVRRKLKAISMISGGLALTIASITFVAYDYLSLRAALAVRGSTLVELIGRQTTAALSFQDAKACEETLESLSAEPRVEAAGIYDEHGRLFGHYGRHGATSTLPQKDPGALGAAFVGGRLQVAGPILFNGQRIGVTRVHFDLGDLTAGLRMKLYIVGVVLAASLLGTYVLTSRLESIVTGPILHLAHTVASVSERKDYSVRARSDSSDELGGLITGFNEMLGQIERRDDELERARNELEKRVEERTSDLVRVNANLQQQVVERISAQESLGESEERFRQLVESSPDAFVIVFGDQLSFMNRGAVGLFGASHADELHRKPLNDLIHPGSRSRIVQRITRAGLAGETSGLHEEKILRLDGNSVDVEMIALPFSAKRGRAVQLVLRDITRRKELDRMKNEFISTVSHELRTPLTSIRGSLKLIAAGITGALAPKTNDMVTIAHDSCERLIHLVNDILDMQKIEAGKMTFNIRPLDLAVQLQKAVEANRAYAQSFGVSITFDNQAAGARVSADSDRLIQVFTNLLSNAVKFSPRNGTVVLTLAAVEKSFRVSVADRGPGIPEEFRSRIFQKFSQADSSDNRSKQGTGLGLSITKAIVDRLGGSIGFDSAVGKGTTFHVELPRDEEPVPSSDPSPGDRPRILVCEDDRHYSKVLKLGLEAAGLAVDIALSAADAKALAERRTYAAMTVDLMLPDQDGAALLQDLRRNPKTRDIPVVVVSAYLDEARRKLAGESAGIIEWLEKPIDENRLKETIRWAIRPGKRLHKILHLEADAAGVRFIREALRGVGGVCPVASLSAAEALLGADSFDLLILGPEFAVEAAAGLIARCRRPGEPPMPVIIATAPGKRLPSDRPADACLTTPEDILHTVRDLLRTSDARMTGTPLNGARL
jgi:PAS domain S-box-containing protein